MKLIEQELKIKLNKSQYVALLKRAKNVSHKMQHNHYFYYDGMSMDKMLRIRHVGDKFELTYKFRKSNANGVMVAEEYNAPVDKEFLTNSINDGISQESILKLLNLQIAKPLRYIGCLSTMRSKFVMCNCNVELDLNEYLGVVDFELECEDDDLDKLDNLRTKLKQAFGEIEESVPKVQRFVDRLASMPAFCDGENNDN